MGRKRALPRKQNTMLIIPGGVYPSGGKCFCLEDDAGMDPDVEAALVRAVRPSESAEGKANCSAGEIHRNSEFRYKGLGERRAAGGESVSWDLGKSEKFSEAGNGR